MRSIGKLTKLTKLIPILGVLALVALGAPNVASAQEAEVTDDVSEEMSRSERVKITVVNRNFADMRVYAVNGVRSWRLGTVTGLTDGTFTLPRFLSFGADEIRLVLRPIGGRGLFSSEHLIVTPGDEVVFYVQNAVGLSSAIVR